MNDLKHLISFRLKIFALVMAGPIGYLMVQTHLELKITQRGLAISARWSCYFKNVFVTNFLTKGTQISFDFLSYLKLQWLLFWATFGKNMLLLFHHLVTLVLMYIVTP